MESRGGEERDDLTGSQGAPRASSRSPGCVLLLLAAFRQGYVVLFAASSMAQMEGLYRDLGSQLPLVTRWFMIASKLCAGFPLATLGAAIG